MKVWLLLGAVWLWLDVAAGPWKGKWIEAADNLERPNTWQVFRKTQTLHAVPRSVVARISVDSKYWLWVNGRQVVFEGGLKRGPTPRDTYYDEVEIAPYLQKGPNTIALLTVYFGKEGFSHRSSGHGALLFSAEGRGVLIASDETWEAQVYKAYGSAADPPNFRLPEAAIAFDGRQDLGAWYAPDYEGHFPKAEVLTAQAENSIYGKLWPRIVPLWKDYGLCNYVSTTFDAERRQLHCRLPYNAQVTPWLRVRAAEGQVIDMRTDNFFYPGEPSVHATYTTRDGVQEYESLGWMNGHEVVYTIPEGVEVLAVKYRESGYDCTFTGAFRCNDAYWNELWKRSVRTLYLNMRDTYFDCPDRERAQWCGDMANEIQETFFTLSPSAQLLTRKGILEVMNWQRPDGTIFGPVPAGNWDKELPVQMLMLVGWYGFYAHYWYGGDATFIPLVYDGLHRYLHDVWTTDDDGLVRPRSGGWSWGDWGDHIDLPLMTNCWYYLALKAEREFARLAGKGRDIPEIETRMARIKENFDRRFWTGTEFRSPDYTEAADDRGQALAVLAGLASEDKYPALMKLFREHWYASTMVELYVQRALFQMGEGEYALRRARERYRWMMDRPITTLHEQWTDVGTNNHAWSGGMVVIFGEYVCGVKPTSPGFRTFDLQPDLAGLAQAETQIDTHYGLIRVAWAKRDGTMHMQLTVPRGTRATVRLGGTNKTFAAGTYSEDFPL